jgi:hypothetical protein
MSHMPEVDLIPDLIPHTGTLIDRRLYIRQLMYLSRHSHHMAMPTRQAKCFLVPGPENAWCLTGLYPTIVEF